jgi:hypothetical protein
MANRRSSSQPTFTEPDRALRLVNSDCAPAADLPNDGIRPTRQGPWDPCRFQEYVLSPEFRMQVMSAKLPPADPKIFLDTVPSTQVTEIAASIPARRRMGVFPMLALGGVLLGLAFGYGLSQHRTRRSMTDTITTEVSGLKQPTPACVKCSGVHTITSQTAAQSPDN